MGNDSAICFADAAQFVKATLLEQEQLARDTFRLRIAAPEIARRILPGQFVMLRLPGCTDPLLGRPFALYDTCFDGLGNRIALDVVYLVVGKQTRLLTGLLAGDSVEVWGPLGNGFAPPSVRHLVMVAGGIGQTPFLSVAREALGERNFGDPARKVRRCDKVTLCYGARSKDYLAGLNDFQSLGVDLRISTDDGSAGEKGFVTAALENVLSEDSAAHVVTCGPEKMLQRVADICLARNVPCYVSLETPMACGIGICFSCVTKVRTENGWDYRRTCVEGPIFDAQEIAWEA
jgi:dihydroorotate dehydrogenase electron transfer subunit